MNPILPIFTTTFSPFAHVLSTQSRFSSIFSIINNDSQHNMFLNNIFLQCLNSFLTIFLIPSENFFFHLPSFFLLPLSCYYPLNTLQKYEILRLVHATICHIFSGDIFLLRCFLTFLIISIFKLYTFNCRKKWRCVPLQP